MRTQRTGAGYLYSDNRLAGQGLEEADVLSCPHCQRLLVGAAGRRDCGFCASCGAPICQACVPGYLKDGCTPFVKLVERRLDALARARAYSRALGLDTPGAVVLREGLTP